MSPERRSRPDPAAAARDTLDRERGSARANADDPLGLLGLAGNRAVSSLLEHRSDPAEARAVQLAPVAPVAAAQLGPVRDPEPESGMLDGIDPASPDLGPEPAEAKGESEQEKALPAHPAWWRMDSQQAALPGDIVPGITDVNRPYTEADREALRGKLDERVTNNKPRATEFRHVFTGGVLGVWTDYVLDEMKEAAEPDGGLPFWARALSFVARSTLLAVLFPESLAEEAAVSVAEKLAELGVEKGLEYGMEEASEGLGDSSAEEKSASKVEGAAERLARLTPVVSDLIDAGLDPVFTTISESLDYERWLSHAPLSELGTFRVPPLLPQVPEAAIRHQVGQALALLARQKSEPSGAMWPPGVATGDTRDDNMLSLTVMGDLAKPEAVTLARSGFLGSHALGKAMAGAAVKELGQLPLHMTFTATPTLPPVTDAGVLEDIIKAYPSRSPTTIERTPGGTLVAYGGGIAEHLILYGRVHVGDDLIELVRQFAHGVGTTSPERTAAMAATELQQHLIGSLQEGADLLMSQSIEPLQLPDEHKDKAGPAKAGHPHP